MKCLRKAFLPLMLDHLYQVDKWEEKKWDVALLKESESPGEVCTNNQAPKWAACNLLWKCTSTPSRVLQYSLWWEVCPLFSSFLCTLISALPSDLLWRNTIFKKTSGIFQNHSYCMCGFIKAKKPKHNLSPRLPRKGKEWVEVICWSGFPISFLVPRSRSNTQLPCSSVIIFFFFFIAVTVAVYTD